MIIIGFWSMWSAMDAYAVVLVPDIRANVQASCASTLATTKSEQNHLP
jgi:hypothetical protein